MVRVTDVHAHRDEVHLAHEMILESCTDDLLVVVQVFRSDEPDDRVDDERIIVPGKTVVSRFKCHLIDIMMRFSRKL